MSIDFTKIFEASGFAKQLKRADPDLVRLASQWALADYLNTTAENLNPALDWEYTGPSLPDIAWTELALPDLQNAPSSEALCRALRRWRNALILGLGAASSHSLFSAAIVGRHMSRMAEIALREALHFAEIQMQSDYGIPLDQSGKPQDLLIVGMGKLGGNELNVSSDIDLVLVHREHGMTSGDSTGAGKIAVSDYFARLIKIVVPLLETRTADGFVFRVDLRLRPHGDSGPPAVSLNYLEDYLISEGRAWERFAWLRARIVAQTHFGSAVDRLSDRTQLEQIVTPFVYRRYLDFAAVGALRDLHGLILREKAGSRAAKSQGRLIDVKLGRGGIREVEFATQLLQIVRAGKDPSLRETNTISAITKLTSRGALSPHEGEQLAQHYDFLRRVEHAIQWRNDEQTHLLDLDDPIQMAQVASQLNLSVLELEANLQKIRGSVELHFDRLSGRDQVQSQRVSATTVDQNQLNALQASSRFRRASESVQALATRLFHIALPKCNSDPARIQRFTDFLDQIIGRPGYLTLLDHHPVALERLVNLFGRSRWAFEFVRSYPVVLDELITTEISERLNWPNLAQQLHEQLTSALLDTERKLDILREFQHSMTLRLLMQESELKIPVERVADDLSALADLIVSETLILAQQDVYGPRQPPPFAVIAYGKLGGKELGYASDLDLVFIYDKGSEQDASDQSDTIFRLARKLINWLTVRTGAGELYDVDIRLRPDGDSGLLVSSFSAFKDYQINSAWLWEHQALTRARFCAGDKRLGEQFETLRIQILSAPRENAAVLTEIANMRDKVHKGHPNRTEKFDLKHDTGGMVDIEFCVQALVLLYGGQYADLLVNCGNLALLTKAEALQLLPAPLGQNVANIYRRMRRLQYDLRLNNTDQVRAEPTAWETERETVKQLWALVFSPSATTPRSSRS